MGHRGEQGVGKAAGPLQAAGVESLDVDPEPGWIAADIVQGQQAAVAIERGVLDALGHDRRGGLLKAGDEGPRAGLL